MLKKTLIIISIFLILGAAFFTYVTWKKDQDLSVWSFIPDTSLIVYETTQPATIYKYLSDQNTWNTLNLIPEVDQINQKFASIDSILNRPNGLLNTLENHPLLISLHSIGRNQFDFLISAELRDIANRNMLSKIQKAYLENGYRKKNRDFLGENITEIIHQGKSVYAYTLYKQYFIGSTTPYLVEDAMRLLVSDQNNSFIQKNNSLRNLVKLEQDQGNLYLNLASFPAGIKDLYPETKLKETGQSGFLDIKIENQSISMDGFSFADQNQWLSTVNKGSGKPMGVTEVIPINASMIQHYSFKKATEWASTYDAYLSVNEPEIMTIRQNLLREFDLDVSYTFQLMGDELAVIRSEGANDPYHLLVLELADTDLMLKYLEGVAERYINKTGDTVLQESYRSNEIYALPTHQFAQALLGNAARDFSDCFYTNYRNYLIISDHLPYLKQTIDDIEDENTWRKSLRKSNFLEKINQEAGYSLLVNLPASLRTLSNGLNADWSDLIKSNDYILRSFENIAVQFTSIDDKYYTNIFIDQPDGSAISEVNPIEKKSISLASRIISKPFLMRDHTSPDYVVMVQDTTYELYWISSDFEVAWSKPLENKIRGKIHTLDYYKNNKIQYAFITPEKVHIIDREGTYLPGFPKSIQGADSLTKFSIVDYDGSKNYRLAISDRRGNIFLTNKEGIPLNGWNPRSFSGPLASEAKHYRISNKDLFLVPLQEGQIHLLNRKSNAYKGFPVNTNEFLSGDIYFNPASSFGSSIFTTVTKNGNLQSFDLQGNATELTQLYKPEKNTEFKLVKDVAGQSYLILRQYDNRIDFLNGNLELLFGKDYLDEQDLFIQYYDINPSKQYIVIGNYHGQFIYIYDLTGRLITSRPLIGNQPVSLMYFEKTDQQMIYLVHENELMLYSLQQ